jgi:hypothetical protein
MVRRHSASKKEAGRLAATLDHMVAEPAAHGATREEVQGSLQEGARFNGPTSE